MLHCYPCPPMQLLHLSTKSWNQNSLMDYRRIPLGLLGLGSFPQRLQLMAGWQWEEQAILCDRRCDVFYPVVFQGWMAHALFIIGSIWLFREGFLPQWWPYRWVTLRWLNLLVYKRLRVVFLSMTYLFYIISSTHAHI